ncbi:MAG: hypothetical protein JO033_26425 [Acidobacteriaceae bacterium]|nr:hypothetical protein [Acidobacteriaceae bacterium]
MERTEGLIDRLVGYAEEVGLFVSFVLLLLVETGYVAWLERLPSFPTPERPNDLLILLPPWYENPKAPTLLLLTIAGGMTVWMGVGLFTLLRRKHQALSRSHVKRAVIGRLKSALLWAILAGADLLFLQLLRT